jgi:hypothetical protein
LGAWGFTVGRRLPVLGRDVGHVVARAHPVGLLDERQVRLGHLVEQDDARVVGSGADEGVEVVEGGRHPGVVLGPHKVDVPGQDREVQRPGGCRGF